MWPAYICTLTNTIHHHTFTHAHIHPHTHTYTHTYMPTHTHTDVCTADMPTHTHTDVCTADICRVKWRSLAWPRTVSTGMQGGELLCTHEGIVHVWFQMSMVSDIVTFLGSILEVVCALGEREEGGRDYWWEGERTSGLLSRELIQFSLWVVCLV